jgi:predicted DNA-binding transcriptional regulator YafY
MTIDVEYPEELKWWIFGFGAKVAVLAPASLRDKLGADLDAAVLRYR